MRYTQGTQRIEVIVRKEGGGIGNAGNKEQSGDQLAGDSKSSIWSTLTGSNRESRQKIGLITNLTHLLGLAKQATDASQQFWIGGVGMRTGDDALQDNIERQYEVWKDSTNLVSGALMGGIYGAWGGPIGIVLGVGINVATTAIGLSNKYAGRRREYNFKVFKENNAIMYRRARAGINLTTGRLR